MTLRGALQVHTVRSCVLGPLEGLMEDVFVVGGPLRVRHWRTTGLRVGRVNVMARPGDVVNVDVR